MPIPNRANLKTIGAVLGILVAGAPIVLFNAWLKKQGDDEAAITSTWALGSAVFNEVQSVATDVAEAVTAHEPIIKFRNSKAKARLQMVDITAEFLKRTQGAKVGGK